MYCVYSIVLKCDKFMKIDGFVCKEIVRAEKDH